MSAQTQEIRAGLATVEAFTVCGISLVTSNDKATDDINALWERFFREQIGQNMPGKVDDTIYAVYSDYEGDHEAPYRLTIGYRIEDLANDNQGGSSPDKNQDNPDAKTENNTPASSSSPELHYAKCMSGAYALLSACGEQPKALIETWEAVWSSDLDRSFATDFEIYGPRFFEEGVNEVLVHVGLNINHE